MIDSILHIALIAILIVGGIVILWYTTDIISELVYAAWNMFPVLFARNTTLRDKATTGSILFVALFSIIILVGFWIVIWVMAVSMIGSILQLMA